MLTLVKLSLIDRIESAITIPKTGYFVKSKVPFSSIRLCYSVEQAIRYIILVDVEIPKFFKKHGLIHSYSFKGDEINMFSKTTTAISGKNGQLVWEERLIPYRWEDIEFNQFQVQTFAAVHEFELANNTIGKVFKNILQEAS